jgi:uncharacterized membrane-anchored protein YhcB (DUF1043 family)
MENTETTTNTQVQEVPNNDEILQLVNEFDDTLANGLSQTTDILSNLNSTTDLETAKNEVEKLKKQLLNEFETTINTLKEAAEKDYAEVQEKLLFSKSLNHSETEKLNKATLIINNIKELETSNNLLDYLDSNNSDDIKNMYKAKILENKFIHKLRTAKIKKQNIEGNYELIINIKDIALRKKFMYFYNLILNTYMNQNLDNYKFYIVFIMGMLRLTIKTQYTFKSMEEIYYHLENIPIPEGLLD